MSNTHQGLWDEGVSYWNTLPHNASTLSLHYSLELKYGIPIFANRELLTLSTRRDFGQGRTRHHTYLQYRQTF